MKLTKILDADNVQGYSISGASKKFKRLFPKKYIISFDMFGKHHIVNINKLPAHLLTFGLLGYVFTYEKGLPNILKSKKVEYKDIGSTFVRCLDNYFIGEKENDSKNVDLILACGAKNLVVPPVFAEEIIIRCNSNVLAGENSKTREEKIKNIRQNVLKVLNAYIKDRKFEVEEWAKDVIFNFPVNNNGLPVRFPKSIDEKSVNNAKLDPKTLFVEYDFRASSYEHENEFVTELEDAFESPNMEVQIMETYNGIIDEIKKKLDEKKYKWKEIEGGIKTKLKYLRNIDMEYSLSDFL